MASTVSVSSFSINQSRNCSQSIKEKTPVMLCSELGVIIWPANNNLNMVVNSQYITFCILKLILEKWFPLQGERAHVLLLPSQSSYLA